MPSRMIGRRPIRRSPALSFRKERQSPGRAVVVIISLWKARAGALLFMVIKAAWSIWVVGDPTNPISASGNLDLYHFNNFIQTIRGEATLNSPVDEASKSVLLCHLANIAQRSSNVLHCNPVNGH